MASIVFPKTELFINLKKSFSKSFFASILSFVFFFFDITLKPWFSNKCDATVNFCHPQPKTLIELQVFVVNHLFFLVIEIWNQFSNPVHHDSLRSEWIIIVEIVKMIRILEINLKDARLYKIFHPPKKKVFQPLKFTDRKRLDHCATIKIICVEISVVFCWLLFIEVGAHVRIVVFSMTI